MKHNSNNNNIILLKYNMGLNRYLLNDKRNPNNYFYSYIKKGLNTNNKILTKNNTNNNKSITNLNHKLNINQKNVPEHYRFNRKNSEPKINNNIKSLNNNKKLNKSMFDFKNTKKVKSVPKENRHVKTLYNKNNNNSFISNKRVKTPLLNINEKNNMKVINNYNKINNIYKNKHNKMNKNKISINYNLNMNGNKSYRNNSSIFQPVNIFSKFKHAKNNNHEEMAKNSQIFKKLLIEEQKNSSNNNNNENKSNNNLINNYKIIVNNNNNEITKSNSGGNLLKNKSNSNRSLNYKLNKIMPDNIINCHEINFHVNGISSSINLKNTFKTKKKVFKGKKIKCMHDLSKTGLSGDDKKVNQDNFFIFKNFVQGFDNIFMGVCDGHGYYGHEVSGYIKENLPMDLNHYIKTKKLNVLTDDLSQVIKSTFISENKALLRNKQIDSDLSGSTCISTIYTPKKLIIANLGDSRCILGKCIEKENFGEKDEILGESQTKKLKWIAKNLSRDHKPTVPEEAQRILKVGGRIRPMKDDDGEFIGPMRVYMKDREMPGLAMTRSFGDYFGSTAGVIPEPEVTEYVFKPEDKFMVLASDGLFEFMESQEIIDIIKDYYIKNDIVGCCEYLYKESSRKWIQEEDDTIDDITMILVFFDDIYEEVEEEE